jgi:hypothetical protein
MTRVSMLKIKLMADTTQARSHDEL